MGTYGNSVNVPAGFLRFPDGTFVEFGVPGASSTRGIAINATGAVTGEYRVADGEDHGYVRSAQGVITTFDVPNSASTTPVAINHEGEITGYANGGSEGIGFVRHADGKIDTFVVPGGTDGTYPLSIDSDGEVAGWYEKYGYSGAFVRWRNGSFKLFALRDDLGTKPVRITPHKFIAGVREDKSKVDRGFIRDPAGKITTFEIANTTTLPTAMNVHNEITGYFGNTTGFIRFYNRKRILTFSVINSVGTYPTAINGKGDIVGSFVGNFATSQYAYEQGFLRTP
ncbi:MAG TPA: hypothetical protein VHY79_18200 [Rhizomicrobium sp.]|nr:hypothetical protein [Rhizomicrobium sp.]